MQPTVSHFANGFLFLGLATGTEILTLNRLTSSWCIAFLWYVFVKINLILLLYFLVGFSNVRQSGHSMMEHLNPFSSDSSMRKRIFLLLCVLVAMSSLQSMQMKCPQGFNLINDDRSSLKQTGHGSSGSTVFVDFFSCVFVGRVRFIFLSLVN